MAWPPAALPTNRTNATTQKDTHPADHNAANLAINDTVTKVKALDAAATDQLGGQMIQAGQVIVTTNSAGGFSITFPKAFGAAPRVFCMDGGAAGTSIVGFGAQSPANAGNFSGVTRFLQTGGAVVSSSVRTNWLAIGAP